MDREEIKLLDIKPPAHLAKALGYRRQSRWVKIISKLLGHQEQSRWLQISFEPCPVDKPVCTDGTRNYYGSLAAWELFSQSFSFLSNFLLNPCNSLLLDQDNYMLYSGDKELILRLLRDPDSLMMLEPVSSRKGWNYRFELFELQELMTQFKKGASFSAGVIAVVLVAGGIISLGSKAASSFADYSTSCQETLIKVINSYPKPSEVPPPK